MADSDDDYERDERAADNARGRKRESKKSKKRSHENPEDGCGGGGGGGGRRGGKKKKVKVMEESGQTDEERRALRRAQRKLQQKILASDKLEDPNADAFEEIRGENNKLFESVRYTREAVMDGDNLQYISDRTVRQVDKLVQVCFSAHLI